MDSDFLLVDRDTLEALEPRTGRACASPVPFAAASISQVALYAAQELRLTGSPPSRAETKGMPCRGLLRS